VSVRKVLVFGLGSIGKRHARNLAALRPDADIIYADPVAHTIEGLPEYNMRYTDWRAALSAHPDADAAIVASPTKYHIEQMREVAALGIPFYVEKPMFALGQHLPSDNPLAVLTAHNQCAVGYQYRFHPVYREVAPAIRDWCYVQFSANENLLDRYGPDCLSIIAAHPIDTALWLLGPAETVDMVTDGLSVSGRITHRHGVSDHAYRIDVGPRVSTVATGGDKVWSLDANNDMYLDAMRAWLSWVEGGQRDERTATLADGLESMKVMAQVKIRKGELI
jgi:predicted dehydrogenase